MAAPELTKWGPIVKGSGNPNGRQGKLGIYTSITNTNTQTTVKVQVWFATIYSCDDYYCTLYYNAGTNVTSATTAVVNNCDIKHTIATGTGWNTANQTKLYEKTYTYNRGTSDTTYKVYAKFSGIDMLDSAMSVNTTYTVPKLTTYKVTYNANGSDVTNMPATQTRTYGDSSFKLSTKVPKRSGYTFLGWSKSSTTTTATYAAGASYTTNADLNLHAVWKRITYEITYNANGGSGAPSKQTKNHGDSTFKLSTTKPVRTNYDFLGWSTSSSATTATYAAGANYTGNANVTLYAVWKLAYTKPVISNFKTYRCKEDGTYDDNGTKIRVSFNWSCFYTATEISIGVYRNQIRLDGVILNTFDNDAVDVILPQNFDTDVTYTVSVSVFDSGGSTAIDQTLAGGNYTVDFLAGGKGVAIGKAAEVENVLDINMMPMFRKDFCMPSQTGSELVTWKPYLTAGDSIEVTIGTAGYVTNGGADITFRVPLSVPVIGNPTVTVTSANGFTLRQGGNYTHGSSSSSYVTPNSYSATAKQWYAGVSITAKMSDLTNVINNSAIGIYWHGYITFS